MTKTFFIPNKQSILGEQEILTAKSILALVDGLESHSYDAVYLRQPLSRLEYIECAIVGQSQFLFKVSYADDQKAYRIDLPDLLTKIDWQIIKSFLEALLAYTGTEIEGLDGFDFEAYFQASIQVHLADTTARFTICQGIFNPVFFSPEDLKSFLEEEGLAQFEARVRALQETDAYFARVSFYQDGEGQVHGVYHLAQGVKTVLPREPFVPAAYMEQLVDKEVQWEIDLVQITGDGSKPEDYEAIARLDYERFLESLPSESYHQLDANQLEVQPILDKDFKTLAQEK
ncbi:DUF4299 family protein [Streptococcus mitis]|uniref:tRNA (5-methylaminomethyl-2-thiouridylate)-methyltransferase n=1 Tax=Streptococcus mitis TaxID=28037 RepID=A0A1X1KP66_STRMT|nr:DUF4299 family protein [Streptococcus mitis]ORP01223.1 hypothetical protein B7695_07170 [Streptococcus mitis]